MDQQNNGQYGVIHEVGDMGLGFTQLPDQKDQKTLQEQERRQQQNNQNRQQNRW